MTTNKGENIMTTTTTKNIDTNLLKLYIQKYEAVILMIEEYEHDKSKGEVFTPVKTQIYKGLLKARRRLHRDIKSLTK